MQLHFQIRSPRYDLAAAESIENDVDSAATPSLSIRMHHAMKPLEARWRALEADNHLSLHQSYDWCRAWAESHDCDLLILEGVCSGRTRFLLPLEIARLGPVRIAKPPATEFSNINTGLFCRTLHGAHGEVQVKAALERARGDLARAFDLLHIGKVPLEWRGRTSPLARLPSMRNQNASYQLELFEDFERTLAQINTKRRRKKARSSERRFVALGGFEHVVAAPGIEALDLLDTFFRQKTARFQAMGLPDVFGNEETRAFFRALVSMPRKNGDHPLELHALRLKGEHEGHIAAITGLSRKGDHVICQFGSIDDSVGADASPGEFLFFLAIEKLCGEGARLFDFGIGDQPYKRSWCTIETPQHDILWPATLAGTAASAAQRAMIGAKRLIKQNPRLYTALQRVRAGRRTEPAGSAAD